MTAPGAAPDLGLLGRCIAALYRLWSWTWRVERIDHGLFESTLAEGPAVVAIWHADQMSLLALHARDDIAGLASQSKDGQWLASVIAHLGYRVFRGSTSRGALGALRTAMWLIDKGISPALAVDGPRGPCGKPQPGAIGLAQKTQRPVLFIACHAHPAIRLGSWDRFTVPLPGARLRIAYGRFDPAGMSRAQATEELGRRMTALTARVSPASLAQPSAGSVAP